MTDMIDPFAMLDAAIAEVMEVDNKKAREKELAAVVKSNRLSGGQKQSAVKELAELREGIEQAKWQPIAVELLFNHITCKGCQHESEQPDGLFIYRKTIAAPRVTSRRRVNLQIVAEQYADLPRKKVLLARQVEVCGNCQTWYGWGTLVPSDVYVVSRNETVYMSATEFFGE